MLRNSGVAWGSTKLASSKSKRSDEKQEAHGLRNVCVRCVQILLLIASTASFVVQMTLLDAQWYASPSCGNANLDGLPFV